MLRVLVRDCHVGHCAPPPTGSKYVDNLSITACNEHQALTAPADTFALNASGFALHVEQSPLPVSQVPKLFL